MSWLTGKLTEVQTLLGTVFSIMVIGVAITLMRDRKIIAIMLFAITAGLLGWFALSPDTAIATFKSLWLTTSSGGGSTK